MTDVDREEVEALAVLAEDVLAQTWAGGELPVGPSISDAFRGEVRDAKTLARGVLALRSLLLRADVVPGDPHLRSAWGLARH